MPWLVKYSPNFMLAAFAADKAFSKASSVRMPFKTSCSPKRGERLKRGALFGIV